MAAHPNASLASLRRELEEIDRALILLIAARIDVACSAIEVRSRSDGRLSDPAQEDRVLARCRTWAELVGIAPETVEPIFRSVLAAGKERFVAARRAEGPAEDIATDVEPEVRPETRRIARASIR